MYAQKHLICEVWIRFEALTDMTSGWTKWPHGAPLKGSSTCILFQIWHIRCALTSSFHTDVEKHLICKV
jgi:hypothetical protein